MKMQTKKAVFMPGYPSINNAQLLKDCGLIPYFLHKNYGMNSIMLTKKADNYTYIDTYAKGLKIEFLETGSVEEKIQYLQINAETIDLLILFGGYDTYMYIAPLYKKLNPDGKIYLALDANSGWMDRIDFKRPLYMDFMDSCDVIATSCRAMQRHLNEKWPWKIEYISNGYIDYTGNNEIPDISQKENTILTVGRNGTQQKRTDILLESFAAIHNKIPGWKLKIIGSVAPEFNSYIEEYFIRYPELKEKVIFTGVISDKLELFQEYRKSKIFALPSDWEGAPNVISEALYNGNAVAITDIDAYEDAIDDGKCGVWAKKGDSVDFALKLMDLCNNQNLDEMCLHAYNYAKRNFDMSKNVDRIYEMLYGGEI